MNLYIETENGATKNHPAFEDNLIQAFESVPSNWEKFIRVERPIPSPYQTMNDEPTYEKVDGVWSDVWSLRDMTAEEKSAKQQTVIAAFNARSQVENWSAWTLDEATCTMQPPIPRPSPVKGKDVRWCGADANWKEIPVRPEGNYKFDFFVWQWVLITQE